MSKYNPIPAPTPPAPSGPQSLTKLAFIRLCQTAGGMTPEMTVAAYNDVNLQYMWLMFDIATGVERDDTDTRDGLDALEALGYLPNGAQEVIDVWPSA